MQNALRAEVIVDPVYPAGHEDCSSVLRLRKGDIVYVMEQHESGWWGGHKEGDETTGWFPANVAVPAGDSIDYDGDDENSRFFGPITTSDHRAVASPQARLRVQESQNQLLQELATERKRVEDLEAECAQLRRERDQDRERERRERDRHEKEKKEQERKESETQARVDREATQMREALRASGKEVERLQNELARKEEQMQHMQQAQLKHYEAQALQASQPIVRDVSGMGDERRMMESSLMSEGLNGTPQPGSGSREDALNRARAASSSITRQLFQQPSAEDAPPPNSARGISRHGSEPIQVIPPTCNPHLAGARIVSAAPPRPSPRGAAPLLQAQSMSTVQQPWRSHSQPATQAGTSAISPRGVKATAATAHQTGNGGSDHRPLVQASLAGSTTNKPVRAIVSEIERRSTSQTPGPMARSANDATPGMQRSTPSSATRALSATIATGTSRTAPLSAPLVTPTATSRVEPTRGRRAADYDIPDLPLCSPRTTDDSVSSWCNKEVVFGMSPMGRPRGAASERVPVRSAGLASPSPTPKGPSIPERIAALKFR
jgi:hypothetical protein